MTNINIKTKLPHPEDMLLLEELKNYEARSMHGQIPVVWDKADNFLIYDRWGNVFIDFTSGIAVANAGHNNKEINSAIRKQLEKTPLSYTFVTEARINYLRELCYSLKNYCKKAFLLSSGTEATDCAVKLMRLHGKQISPNKTVIISFYNSMHGRTMCAEMLKNDMNANRWYDNDKNMYHIPFPHDEETNDFDKVMQFIESNMGLKPSNICGFMIESYQGWSARFYPKDYIKKLEKYAKKNDALICFDEIQAGFGRTGKMFAFEHYDIIPDLICCGKGISSSVPLSAVIGKKEVIDICEVGSMSSTHSANPLACAAGLANLKEIQKLLPLVEEKSRILKKALKSFDKYEVNCEGLVAAIVTPDEKTATSITLECFKKGLLLIWTHKNSVKIAPPLSISIDALEEGLSVLTKVASKYL